MIIILDLNEEKLYKRVNNLIEEENFLDDREKEGMLRRTNIENEKKLKEVLIKIITIDSGYYFFGLDTEIAPHDNFKLTSSKTIEFGNGLIPAFKVKTNRKNSTIEIEVVD